MFLYEVLHKDKIAMGEFEKDETARIYTRKKFKHVWLKKDGEKFYFKERLPKKEIYIGDVVAPYFFERVGLKPKDYVMYYLVEAQGGGKLSKPGVLSKGYIGRHEFQLSYYDIALFCYCLDNDINYSRIKDDKILGLEHSSKINKFEQTFKENPGEYLVAADDMLADIERFSKVYGVEVDMDDIEFRLKRMLIADFFLCQLDRHRGNTEFKIKHNRLTMCPIFDHEQCLAVALLGKAYNMDKFPIYTGFSSIGAKGGTLQAELMPKTRLFRNNGLMACDIIAECLRDERLRAFTLSFFSLDGKKVLDDFEKDYMEINLFIKQCMVDQFETMQEKFAIAFSTIDRHFRGKKIKNAKYEAMREEFREPLERVLGKMKKRNAEINPAKKAKASLDEEYLLGLLGGE